MTQKLKFASLAILGLCVSTGEAQDSGLVLTIGRLRTNSVGAIQVLGLENRTAKTLSRVRVECGFYTGDKLVGSGGASFHDLQPGTIGHNDASAVGASDADNVKCRIESKE